MPNGCRRGLHPPSFIFDVNTWRNVLEQHPELVLWQAALEPETNQKALEGASEIGGLEPADLHVVFQLQSHADDLVVSVAQQEVQVIQRRRVFVFESIQESLLDHAQLNRPLLKKFALICRLGAELEVEVELVI